MKEIVIISGKGGTGKTSLTAAFAQLEGKSAIVADCDVDAADMHLLLKPDFAQAEDFFSGKIAKIDPMECINCGNCAQVCHFNAIIENYDTHQILEMSCEGCGYCARICPVSAIQMVDLKVGKCYISTTKNQTRLVHARLNIGAENSGKLVTHVKKKAKDLAEKQSKELVIVDGSPGIGCPVVASLSGADYVVLVTEPSVSGLHDLKRVSQVVKNFNIPAVCLINKADLNPAVTQQIKEFLAQKNIGFINDLPYDETFSKAMTHGQTIIEYQDGELKNLVTDSWEKIKQLVRS